MKGRRRRIALAVVAAAAIGGVVLLVFNTWSRAQAARRLPPMPDLTGHPVALVAHVVEADANARTAPSNADAVGALGMAYHGDLLYEPAIAAYSRAAELDPGNWRWSYYRALVHFERGEAEAAGDCLRVVVASQPDLAIAWWRLGESAFKLARHDAADAAYAHAESATAADAGEVRLHAAVGRARIALLRGDPAAAEQRLRRVLERAEWFGPAHRVLAEALRALERATESEIHATRAAALEAYAAPHDPLLDALADTSRSTVFLLRQAAATDLARHAARREQLVRRALESDPENADLVYEMGALLQQLHRPADALPYFQRHLGLVPDAEQTLVQIGKTYSDLGRYDEAETMLRRALALRDDAVGFYNLGIVLEMRDRPGEAEASYRRAVALGPDLASARNNLGALLAESGRVAEASEHLRESIRLDPSKPDAYTNMAALLLQRGEVADAARFARLAIAADPGHADAHANLAVALANLGDLDLARTHLAEALRLDPRHEQARRNLAALNR